MKSTNNIQSNQAFTLSQESINLLNAMRSVEAAKNYYYMATESWRGNLDQLTNHMTEDEEKTFDAAFDLIGQQLLSGIRTWAGMLDPNNPI